MNYRTIYIKGLLQYVQFLYISLLEENSLKMNKVKKLQSESLSKDNYFYIQHNVITFLVYLIAIVSYKICKQTKMY